MAASDTASVNNTDSVLTPTTTKILTQLLESEDCSVAKVDLVPTPIVEEECFVVPHPPSSPNPLSIKKENTNGNRKSFVKLDSSSWQGGTTTVITPTTTEQLTILDRPNPSSTFSMKTRSSSRTSRSATLTHPQIPVTTSIPRRQANVKRTPKNRPGVKANTNEFDLSPEDAEKLRVRRERNKAAAARCRKRRLDQISTLSEEVEEHESKKKMLEETIAQLRAQKEELEYILAQHRSECHLQIPEHLPIAVKSEPMTFEKPVLVVEQKPMLANNRSNGLKPKRPLTLNISSANEIKASAVEGIVIDTPSNVIANLGFDTLMTSTGLTPTTNIITPVSFNITTSASSIPTCSSQQRSSEFVLSDLNTPASENLSLVSL